MIGCVEASMAFTVNDYRDLVRLLEEHPEWRVDLRRLLLADDILELPRIVRELAEAQQVAGARLDRLVQTVERLEATVADLTKAQLAANERLDRLEQTVERLEATMADLGRRVGELTDNVARLASTQEIMAGHVSELRGWRVEANFRERPYAYFGLRIRKARAIRPDELIVVEQAREKGQLSDREWEDLMVLDALIQGRIGNGEQARDIFLALEASAVIDRKDVDRAFARANILRTLGLPVIPAVGGDSILPEADQLARQLKVAVSSKGAITFWPEVA
jgi:uncharacterized protein (UPF0335 family)